MWVQGRPAASCPRVREWVSGFFVFEGVVGAGASFPVWGSGLAGPLRTARNSASFPVWESGSPGGGGSDAVHPRGLDMPDVTFARPDPTALRRLDGSGPEVAGRRLGPDRAVPARRVVGPGRWRRRCGREGAPRDSAIRRPAHEPFGWRPAAPEAAPRRHRRTGCGRAWRQDAGRAAEPRAPGSRGIRRMTRSWPRGSGR